MNVVRFRPLAAPAATLILFAMTAAAPAVADPCSSELLAAIQRGDPQGTSAALAAGASARCTDDSGASPLHILVTQAGDPLDVESPDPGPLCRLLVERGADADALDAQGQTPLMLACLLQKPQAVAALLGVGADPNFAGPDSTTALAYALRGESLDIVAALLTARADPNQTDGGGSLPLIDAVTAGRLDQVRLLMRAGADPQRVSGLGTSALDHARVSGDDAAQIMLELPVSPEERLETVDPVAVAKAEAGRDPQVLARLDSALQYQQYGLLEDALAGGADPNALYLGRSAVNRAVDRADFKGLDLLLAHGGRLDVSADDGDTPLIHAVVQGDELLLKALLARGANPDFVSATEATALMAACETGNLKFARLLLDAGARPDVKGASGMTALFWAAKDNHKDIVQELIKRHADLDITDDQYGSTALMMAMSSGKYDCLKALLEAGADPTIVMKGQYAGMTAVDAARMTGDPELIKLLEKAAKKRK